MSVLGPRPCGNGFRHPSGALGMSRRITRQDVRLPTRPRTTERQGAGATLLPSQLEPAATGAGRAGPARAGERRGCCGRCGSMGAGVPRECTPHPIRERVLVLDDGAISDGGANRRAVTVRGTSTLGVEDVLRPLEELGAELDRPALALRIRVSVHRRVLDKDLAHGDSPLRSDAHALRARQLVERRSRERLARALERLVEGAERTPSPSEIVWLPKREILDARAGLLRLAGRLGDARPVYARGVAMVSRLVCDGTGP